MADASLIEHLRASLASGKTREDLYKELLMQGWTIEAIQAAFLELAAPAHKEESQKRTVRIVVTLGAISIGVGIFSFIASNWDGFSKGGKVALILAAMIISYVLGWLAEHRAGLIKTAHAMYLLGVLIYGGGIFLVAQIFNIQANWPDGFLLWLLGAIGMAFAVDAFILFYLSVILAIVALFGLPGFLFDVFVQSSSFLLTSNLLLIVSFVTVLATGITLRKRMPLEQRNLL